MLSLGAAFLLIVFSKLVLSLYGPAFSIGRLPFSLIVLSAVPMVLANVYSQELLGAARLWRILVLYLPHIMVLVLCYWLLIPRFGALGYGVSSLVGAVVLLVTLFRARSRGSVERRSTSDRVGVFRGDTE